MTSVDKKGTHTIQSILDTCLTQDEEDLISKELISHIPELANV